MDLYNSLDEQLLGTDFANCSCWVASIISTPGFFPPTLSLGFQLYNSVSHPELVIQETSVTFVLFYILEEKIVDHQLFER